MDLSKSNALVATITGQADSLDLTPWYDLAAGQKSAAPAAKTSTTSAPESTPAPASPAVEPAALQLPIQKVAFNLNIGRLFLHDVVITNWQTALNIEGSHVVLNPLSLNLNGAPIKTTADINVGVKGYTYQLTFLMDKVPVKPLASSFAGDKGTVDGVLVADVDIKGAGITPPSLRSNLNGHANFALTNATIALTSPVMKYIEKWVPFLPIAAIQSISDKIKVPELTTVPITEISSSTALGQGKISIQSSRVVSPSFMMVTHGDIPIADVLTDSPLNMPVEFSLSRSLAQKANLMPSDAAPTAQYGTLPSFISVTGTLGKPDHKFDAKGLGMIALQVGTKALGGQTGQIVKGLSGILGGQSQSSTNAAGTNAPSNTPMDNLNKAFNLFGKPKK